MPERKGAPRPADPNSSRYRLSDGVSCLSRSSQVEPGRQSLSRRFSLPERVRVFRPSCRLDAGGGLVGECLGAVCWSGCRAALFHEAIMRSAKQTGVRRRLLPFAVKPGGGRPPPHLIVLHDCSWSGFGNLIDRQSAMISEIEISEGVMSSKSTTPVEQVLLGATASAGTTGAGNAGVIIIALGEAELDGQQLLCILSGEGRLCAPRADLVGNSLAL